MSKKGPVKLVSNEKSQVFNGKAEDVLDLFIFTLVGKGDKRWYE